MHHLLVLTTLAVTVLAVPTPPGVPTSTTAQSELSALTVAARSTLDGYSRDEFPHWITQSGKCDTREVVLARDGTDVTQSAACSATGGTWVSAYDGARWTASGDVDIDHMVPLANAWVSGAAEWTIDQRQGFANDLENPQLWTVTDNVNESKGDRAPDEWKPPLESFYCTYAEAFVKVKSVYKLTVTAEEKSALSDMLDTC